MKTVLIIGSGASAVHFALSVLRKGYKVLMLDVGNHQKNEPSHAGYNFNELKDNLGDPVKYFLGDQFQGITYPGFKGEYYALPPTKDYVFAGFEEFEFAAEGFAPLVSFAQGGLAEAWTGGVYPFNDDELADFPFGYAELAPFYDEIARRIGITGMEDDLSRFIPAQNNLLEPLELDQNSAALLSEYRRHKEFLNRLGFYFGRSRVATLSRDQDGRGRCDYLGRCLWGCPSQAFYTPAITLQACRSSSNFEYMGNMYVTHFRCDSKGRARTVIAKSLPERKAVEFTADRIVLAAGTLCSSQIFLRSLFEESGQIVALPGLMDNRQVLVPFVNLKMIGKTYNPRSYQYHHLALGIEHEDRKQYIHGLVTTLKTALAHPLIQRMPFDLKTSIFAFRHMRAALGLVNINFADTRRQNNYVCLETKPDNREPRLLIRYSPPPSERSAISAVLKRVKRALWKLKCVVPPGLVHVRPMGASVHYAGTIPMSIKKAPYTTSPQGQSHDFQNLYIVDGATFPFLPAKNITFTLMANAVRIAETAF